MADKRDGFHPYKVHFYNVLATLNTEDAGETYLGFIPQEGMLFRFGSHSRATAIVERVVFEVDEDVFEVTLCYAAD